MRLRNPMKPSPLPKSTGYHWKTRRLSSSNTEMTEKPSTKLLGVLLPSPTPMTTRKRLLHKRYEWMIGAVSSKAHPDFDKFGKVGITVDENWQTSFEAFLEDVQHTLPRSLDNRRMFLKPLRRRFEADTIEWGFKSKLVGLRLR